MNFNETTHSMSGIYRILFENEKSYREILEKLDGLQIKNQHDTIPRVL